MPTKIALLVLAPRVKNRQMSEPTFSFESRGILAGTLICLSAIAPTHRPVQNCHEEYDILHLTLGFRLNGTPQMGDNGENESQRENSQLLVVFGLSHCDSCLGFASPNQLLLGGGAIIEIV